MPFELYNCPICKDLPIQPRIYECGHCVCEPCMKLSDASILDRIENVFELPHYSCCVCRVSTFRPWEQRPVNRALLDILLQYPEYKKMYHEYKKDSKNEKIDMDLNNIDLSNLCETSRKRVAEDIYIQILPLLYKAAIKGQPYIMINTLLSRQIRLVVDIISNLLFTKHNVYKITCTYRECIIEFIKTTGEYVKSDYINEHYINPNAVEQTRTVV